MSDYNPYRISQKHVALNKKKPYELRMYKLFQLFINFLSNFSVNAVCLVCVLGLSVVPIKSYGKSQINQSNNPKPYFLMGDGKLKLKNEKTGQVSEIIYTDNNTLLDNAFTQIDELFGFPTKTKGENMSRRTIAMLDYFSDQIDPNAIIHIISSYRSPNYNQSLRNKGRNAAKTSTHIDGMAFDFSLDGVDAYKLWDKIRHLNCCGIGHYGGKVLHIDSGRPRFWQAHTSKTKTKASDFNRFIYLSTEYDRYTKEETVRLLFTSISDFGFGIVPKIKIYAAEKQDGEKQNNWQPKGKAQIAELKNSKSKTCHMIEERQDARFLYVDLPKKVKPGMHIIEVEFCQKVAKEMPDNTLTNMFEIVN